ncbi:MULTISPECIES: GNAT family N-acetyltransferase [Actinoplanes]|uniref:GNAT family N-acetyltransferase n=1 Tax=Actinoplanes TaxID=1865 RepID=UPI0005F2D0C8|nr:MULTISPECIES: GNAT family N-acetyltransferase [Actinoplanes]GLY04368.1 hypothetical protein Acsp01_47470 [Actinoplanes sp. NBRC 101535]
MSALTELVVRWQRGWGVARGLDPARDVGGALRVAGLHVARDIEYVITDSDRIGPLVSLARTENGVIWLSVASHDPDRTVVDLEAAGLTILKRTEMLMAADLLALPRPPATVDGYTLTVEAAGDVITVLARDTDGLLGARGTVGCSGADAVADRIETMPGHRRRGLGSAVMGALSSAAVARGSVHGLLIASEEGQLLYTRLGWRPVAEVVIASFAENGFVG